MQQQHARSSHDTSPQEETSPPEETAATPSEVQEFSMVDVTRALWQQTVHMNPALAVITDPGWQHSVLLSSTTEQENNLLQQYIKRCATQAADHHAREE